MATGRARYGRNFARRQITRPWPHGVDTPPYGARSIIRARRGLRADSRSIPKSRGRRDAGGSRRELRCFATMTPIALTQAVTSTRSAQFSILRGRVECAGGGRWAASRVLTLKETAARIAGPDVAPGEAQEKLYRRIGVRRSGPLVAGAQYDSHAVNPVVWRPIWRIPDIRRAGPRTAVFEWAPIAAISAMGCLSVRQKLGESPQGVGVDDTRGPGRGGIAGRAPLRATPAPPMYMRRWVKMRRAQRKRRPETIFGNRPHRCEWERPRSPEAHGRVSRPFQISGPVFRADEHRGRAGGPGRAAAGRRAAHPDSAPTAPSRLFLPLNADPTARRQR